MKARALQLPTVPETNGSRLFLLVCAWGVHLYTASGAVFGLLAIHYAAVGDYRASFLAMAITIAIDSSDGTLALLQREFALERRATFARQTYSRGTDPVTYRSRTDPRLVVVDRLRLRQ